MGCAPCPAAEADAFETPRLSAADLVRPELLHGAGYEILPRVSIEGERAVFQITSAHGDLRVTGVELLAVRLPEFEAIATLGRIHKGEAFLDALAKAAKAPVTLFGNLLDDPKETMNRVVSGLGVMVDKVGGFIRSGVAAVTEAADSPAPEAKGDVDGEPAPPAFANDPFGYNKARRQWAKSLKIDPYTSNRILKGLLDDAASATFAGSFAVDTTLGIVAAPVNFAVGLERESQDALWDLAPADVAARNETRLKAMGIADAAIRDLLRNRWLTPTLQTALVDAIEDLAGIPGIEELVAAGARTRGEPTLRALIYAIDLMGRHRGAGGDLARIRFDSGFVVAESSGGRTVLASAADYLYWHAGLAAVIARHGGGAKPSALLCSASVSPRARAQLQAAGWTIVENPATR